LSQACDPIILREDRIRPVHRIAVARNNFEKPFADSARVIATGRSTVSGPPFNIA
jgi:hypothetical protein